MRADAPHMRVLGEMRDPYEVLGVTRKAGYAEIKSAYRALAKKFHPDTDPGNPRTVERFQEISAAYDLLRDKRRRRLYDSGEIDANGTRRARNGETARGPGHEAWQAGFGAARGRGDATGTQDERGDFNFAFKTNDREEAFSSQGIFSELFGHPHARPKGLRMRGADVNYRLKVSFLEAANGAVRRVRLPGGRRLDLTIPRGVDTNQHIRLKGQGEPGRPGFRPGDAIVVIEVEDHPLFRRSGLDIHMDLPVTVQEAMLGGKVAVPTISGPVAVNIPAGSNSGTVLRLKDRGIIGRPGSGGDMPEQGSHYVTLSVMLPDPPDAAFVDFIRGWAPDHPYPVREEPDGTEDA